MTGIYKITFIGTERVYIGSSFKLKTRRSTHLTELRANRHHSIKLQNAYNKYGEDNFIFEVLEELDNLTRDELFQREQYYMENYSSFKDGYNMSPNAWTMVKQWTDEDKLVKSEAMTGEGNHFFGKTHSGETKRKLSENAKQRIGEKNPFYGKKHSEETKDKLRNRPVYNKVSCYINDIFYDTIMEASINLGIPYKTVRRRLSSNKFPNYIIKCNDYPDNGSTLK